MERDQSSETALALMRRALNVLDAGGHLGPATHLQRAIDDLTGAPIPRTETEAEAFLDSPEGRALQDLLARNSGEVGDDA